MSEIEDIAAEAYRDPVFFSKYFLEHLFPYEIPWLHRGIFAILTEKTDFLWEYGDIWKLVTNFVTMDEDEKEVTGRIFVPVSGAKEISDDELRELEAQGKRCELRLNTKPCTLLMIPRGFGKTTVVGNAIPLYEILFHDWIFGVYVSEASTHAESQADHVRRELAANERIQSVFGNLVPERNGAQKWTQEFFETTSGMAMAARGRGAQIRGIKHLGSRPTKIICDDLEDLESVETEQQRLKVRTWAYGDLMPALADGGRIHALGTKLHKECLLEYWARDPRFTTVKFGARDRQGEFLWPRKMDDTKLVETRDAFSLAGQLHTFYLEYFNRSVSADTNPFSGIALRYEEPEPAKIVARAIYVDPAISQKTTADDTVIAVGARLDNGLIIIEEMIGGKLTPSELVSNYFSLAKQYQCRFHGFESVAFQASLKYTFIEEMYRNSWYFEPIPVMHTTKKAERFQGILLPRMASGYIRFAKKFPKLEIQLRDWNPMRKEQKDDWPDTVCGVVELLDPVAGTAAGMDFTKNEYKPLDEELGNWRFC